MVSLIEHAEDARVPANTAWLLSGAVAVGLLALVFKMTSLVDFERHAALYRPLSGAMVVAAVVALAFAWLRPAPWALALLLVLTLIAVWGFAVDRWLRLPDPDAALPEAES